MKQKDMKIEPIIKEDELLFYFTSIDGEMIKNSSPLRYEYIEKFINKLIERSKLSSNVIGLIGDAKTIKTLLLTIMEEADSYETNMILNDFGDAKQILNP